MHKMQDCFDLKINKKRSEHHPNNVHYIKHYHRKCGITNVGETCRPFAYVDSDF